MFQKLFTWLVVRFFFFALFLGWIVAGFRSDQILKFTGVDWSAWAAITLMIFSTLLISATSSHYKKWRAGFIGVLSYVTFVIIETQFTPDYSTGFVLLLGGISIVVWWWTAGQEVKITLSPGNSLGYVSTGREMLCIKKWVALPALQVVRSGKLNKRIGKIGLPIEGPRSGESTNMHPAVEVYLDTETLKSGDEIPRRGWFGSEGNWYGTTVHNIWAFIGRAHEGEWAQDLYQILATRSLKPDAVQDLLDKLPRRVQVYCGEPWLPVRYTDFQT